MSDPKTAAPFAPKPQPFPTQCIPPARLVCGGNPDGSITCQCAETGGPTPRPPTCTLSLVFPSGNPQGVYIGPLETGCDQAGVEIALAVLLARILSGPPLP